jgi:ribosomal protein S12 methylthiotransferase accessory factor
MAAMEMEIYFKGGKKVDAHWQGFTIATDQSVENGGSRSAPEPCEYFLAAIGTCAGIYIKNFCDLRGLSADAIKITQRADVDRLGIISKIALEIKLPGDFPEKYKKAVINSAALCAVKKHISKDVAFDICTVSEQSTN